MSPGKINKQIQAKKQLKTDQSLTHKNRSLYKTLQVWSFSVLYCGQNRDVSYIFCSVA